MKLKRKKIISWALYDWANSGFATIVMASFFPVFFKDYWSKGVDPSLTTFHLGTANSLAGLTIAAIAPLLGAIADRGGLKKKFLLFFAFVGIATTAFLSSVPLGEWKLAAFLYLIAIIGFYGGNIFYDSLIVNVSSREKLDLVSALGYSLGYLGGGILFTLTVIMLQFPEVFNLGNSVAAIRLSFILVA
ncbi:MAG: MFS transporter, partial [Desulfobacterota bacterium]|nr:MFS transporter [Thermodesulfobacteriota bacterium]